MRSPIHKNRKKRNFSRRVEEPYRINHHIVASKVRVIGESGNLGVQMLPEALRLAKEEGLDLVEISPSASPPVCRIADYSKLKYELKKKKKENKAKTQKVVIKEVRFGPNTNEHDFNFKIRHAESFLDEGIKVKAYVHFMGRSIIYKERGEELLLRFATQLEKKGEVEHMPMLEGKRMHIILSPIVKKKQKNAQSKNQV